MGIDLYGLTSGLQQDLLGMQEGQKDRRALERQARMDLLQERLVNAQIGRLGEGERGIWVVHAGPDGTYKINTRTGQAFKIGEGRSPTKKLLPYRDPTTGQGFGYDPETNTYYPSTIAPTADGAAPMPPPTPALAPPPVSHAPAPAPVVPAPNRPRSLRSIARFGVKPQRFLGTDAQGNNVVVSVPSAGGTPSVTAVPGAGKPVSEKERQDAADAMTSERDDKALTALEADPNTRTEVAQFMAAPAIAKLIPWEGGGLADLISKARLAGVSDRGQEYIKRFYDYASVVGPKLYGLQAFRSNTLLEVVWSQFGTGQLGIGEAGVRATQANRRNATHRLRAMAGERALGQAAPEFAGDTTATPSPPTINPRFDPRRKP